VFGNFIEFKSLDMRERLRFRKVRNCLQLRAWGGEAFFAFFMRILLSERQVHYWLSLIS